MPYKRNIIYLLFFLLCTIKGVLWWLEQIYLENSKFQIGAKKKIHAISENVLLAYFELHKIIVNSKNIRTIKFPSSCHTDY
jgi:hypothetical protein